jgi:patatin-like phospholipase/acyl hydrolase
LDQQCFEKAFILRRLKHLYKSEPLTEKLKEVFGADTTLDSDKLKCLLLVVTRNVTTDSPWPISTIRTRSTTHRSRRSKYADPALATRARQHGGARVFSS